MGKKFSGYSLTEESYLTDNPLTTTSVIWPGVWGCFPALLDDRDTWAMYYRMSRTDGVDVVVADLEDGTPAHLKGDQARASVSRMLHSPDMNGKLVAVRVNGPNSECSTCSVHSARSEHFLHWRADVDFVLERLRNRVHIIVIPDVRSAEEIDDITQVIGLGSHRHAWTFLPTLQVQIESPAGLRNIDAILSSSRLISSVLFGPADFSGDMGMELADEHSKLMQYARCEVAVAAAAAGILAVDSPYLAFRDAEGHLKRNQESARCGMHATWIIHPQQADIAASVYAVNYTRAKVCRQLLELYCEHKGGAFRHPETNQMVDRATVRFAAATLVRALGGKDSGVDRAMLRRLNADIEKFGGNLFGDYLI